MFCPFLLWFLEFCLPELSCLEAKLHCIVVQVLQPDSPKDALKHPRREFRGLLESTGRRRHG
ncbi:hypothetical protein LEMLEM_LOCUS8836 [Lemmus lemmus]